MLRLSKFLSLVLRHKPETNGITLDARGWAILGDLLAKAKVNGRNLTLEKLREVVRENDTYALPLPLSFQVFFTNLLQIG